MRALRPAALVAAVSLLVTPALASAGTAGTASFVSARAQAAAAFAGQIHGVVLNAPNGDPMDSAADLQRIKADGFTLISVYITWRIHNSFSSDLSRRPDTPSDASLTRLASLAHRQGLAVEWMPIVTPAGGAPRYDIEPNNMAEWWTKYTAMIDHYARLAATSHVELYSIGSELGALQKYSDKWITIIDDVRNRAHYQGFTTYMSTTGQGFSDLTWWGGVDLLSVSPYYSLSPAKVPSVNNLVAAWRNQYLPDLRNLWVTYNKPVLMDEIGYPNANNAAYRPAVAWRNHNATPNQQAQANAYEALLKVSSMDVYRSWLKGVVWFFWGKAKVRTGRDTSYSPRSKQAECVVAKYWAQRGIAGNSLAASNGQTCFATHLA